MPSQRQALHNLAAALRATDEGALDERLDALLRDEWEQTWRDQLQAYLTRLADPTLDGRL
jgi:thioester reductase-like protein